jgi:hypothetical protein
MTRLPPTKAFLDLQMVSLRDRTAAMEGAAMTDDVAAKLAMVVEELGEAELLLGPSDPHQSRGRRRHPRVDASHAGHHRTHRALGE